MVSILFNGHGYEFQSGLDVLRKSVETGSAALKLEINGLQQQLDDYRESGEFEGERDADGHVLWERDDVLHHEVTFACEALMELRKAFAIAAFHHWERSVLRWTVTQGKTVTADGIVSRTPKPPRGFACLSQLAANVGYPTDPELCRVVALANTLKHNSEKAGSELLRLWLDLFPPDFVKPSRLSDWVSSIQLTDDHLNEVFDLVSKSGPTTQSVLSI